MVFNRLKKTRKYVRNLMRKTPNKNKSKQKYTKNKNKTSKVTRRPVNKITHDLIDLNSSFTNQNLPAPPSRVVNNPSSLSRTAKAIRNVFYTPENTNIDKLKKLKYDPYENAAISQSLRYVNRNTKKRDEIKKRQSRIAQNMKIKHYNKYKPLSNDLIDLRSRNSNKGHKVLNNGTVNRQMRNMLNKNTTANVILQHSKKFKSLSPFKILSEIQNMVDDLKWSGYTENDAIIKFFDIIDETFGKFYDDRFKIIRDSDKTIPIVQVIAEWEFTQKDKNKRDKMSFMNEIILYQEDKIKDKRFLYKFAKENYKNDRSYKLVLRYINSI